MSESKADPTGDDKASGWKDKAEWAQLRHAASVLHASGGEFVDVAEQIVRMARGVELHYELNKEICPEHPALCPEHPATRASADRLHNEAKRVAAGRVFVGHSPDGEDCLLLLEHLRSAAGWLPMIGHDGVNFDPEEQALNEAYCDPRLVAVPRDTLLEWLHELKLPPRAQVGTREATEQQRLKYPTISAVREAEVLRLVMLAIGCDARQSAAAMAKALNVARREREEVLGDALTRPKSKKRRENPQEESTPERYRAPLGMNSPCIAFPPTSSAGASPGSSGGMGSGLLRRRSG